jgi:hypothetical protein
MQSSCFKTNAARVSGVVYLSWSFDTNIHKKYYDSLIISVILSSLIFIKKHFRLYAHHKMLHLKFTQRILKVAVPYTYSVLAFLYTLSFLIEGVSFKTQPNNNHVLGTKMKLEACPSPCNRLPNIPRDTRVKVTLVARLLLMPVARKLCRCEHDVFTSRTCAHSRTLVCIEIVCCCS